MLDKLQPRQMAAILAGLRILQYTVAVPQEINEILTNGGTTDPLSLGEIDALCEQINMGAE